MLRWQQSRRKRNYGYRGNYGNFGKIGRASSAGKNKLTITEDIVKRLVGKLYQRAGNTYLLISLTYLSKKKLPVRK